MKKYIILASIATAFIFGLSSCSDFLDELPDNRTELTPDNVSTVSYTHLTLPTIRLV